MSLAGLGFVGRNGLLRSWERRGLSSLVLVVAVMGQNRVGSVWQNKGSCIPENDVYKLGADGEEPPWCPPSSAKTHQETPWAECAWLWGCCSPLGQRPLSLICNSWFCASKFSPFGAGGVRRKVDGGEGGGGAFFSPGPLSNQREPGFKGFPFGAEPTGNMHH